jgi:MFS family permease
MLVPAFAAHRSELFPTRVRATAAGWITNAAILGSIAGFAIGAVVVDRIGLPRTISLLAAGLLIAALLVTRLPETRGLDLVRSRPRASAATAATADVPSESPTADPVESDSPPADE